MNYKFIAAALAAVGIAFGAHSAHAADTYKLKFAHQVDASYYLPYYAARDLGWYKEWGLDIQDIILQGDAQLTASILSGDSDIASTGPLNFYNALEKGAPLKAIGSTQMTADFLVIAGPQYKNLKDLAGKTFATSGPSGLPQALPKMLFQVKGIDEKGTSYIAVGSQSSRLQAVIAGKADGTLVDTVTSIKGIKAGQVNVVETASDYFPLIGFVYDIVPEASLKDAKKRAAFEIFLRGLIKGARLVVDNPDKAAEILNKYYNTYSKDELVDAIKKINAQKVWPINGGIDPAVTEYSTKFYYDTGELKKQYKVSDVIDASVADAVLKQEGKR